MSSQAKTQVKTYHDTIRDESTLTKASQGKATLETLLQSGWKSAVSQWGRKQLLAHHVVCSEPAAQLLLLKNFQNAGTAHPCIAELIDGPASINALKNGSEPQIVQRYQPDSLGYVWAAMLPFVRAGARSDAAAAGAPSTPKQKRERKAPERYGGGVPPDQADLGSSPESGRRPATSGSDSSFASTGYMERLEGLLLEDATIRLASCFIRCVLNYAQPVDKREPFLEFRDERLTYSYRLGGSQDVHAVDDGGIQVIDPRFNRLHQVALLEGKRTFQKITDGVADITDELLGQMVGEALALQQNSGRTKKGNLRTDFVTILAATHCVRLFHFHIPVDYIESYENLSSTGPGQVALKGVLRVNSTNWLDIKLMDHRKIIASHLLALMVWANQELA